MMSDNDIVGAHDCGLAMEAFADELYIADKSTVFDDLNNQEDLQKEIKHELKEPFDENLQASASSCSQVDSASNDIVTGETSDHIQPGVILEQLDFSSLMEEFSVSVNPDYKDENTPDTVKETVSKQRPASNIQTVRVSSTSFQKDSQLEVSKPNLPAKKQYICTVCDKHSTTSSNLRRHMRTHVDKKDEVSDRKSVTKSARSRVWLQCTVCPQQFSQLSSLKLHHDSHVDSFKSQESVASKRRSLSDLPHPQNSAPKSNRCIYCEERFSCQSDLEVHSCIRTFVCTLCDHTFINAYDLRNHMHVHRHEETKTCRVCNKQFKFLYSAVRHIHTHNGMQTLSCDVCGEKFRNSDTLKEHSNLHSIGESITCEFCQEKYTNVSDFMRHKISHQEKAPYRCEYCNNEFWDRNKLGTHLGCHVAENLYACVECENVFASCWDLRAHMRDHSREEMFTCHICGKKVKYRSNFTRHVSGHRYGSSWSRLSPGDRGQLVCDVCGKQFLILSKFESHRRIHLGKREISDTDSADGGQTVDSNEGSLQEMSSTVNDESDATPRADVQQEVVGDVVRNQTSGSALVTLSKRGRKNVARNDVEKQTRSSKQVKVNPQENASSVGRKQVLFSHELRTPENIPKQTTDVIINSLQLVSDELTRTCSVCAETFVNFSNLETHLHTHRHEKSFRCNICNKEIAVCKNFIRHMKRHISGLMFFCGICGKKSDSSDVIASHVCSHSESVNGVSAKNVASSVVSLQVSSAKGGKSFTCEQRSEIVLSHRALDEARINIDSSNQQTVSNVVKSPVCSSTELTSNNQNRQQIPVIKNTMPSSRRSTVAESTTRTYICSVCAAKFAKFYELVAHLHVHRHEELFVCNLCNKRITHCNNFIRHMQHHFAPPLFSCGVCGVRRYEAADLKRHMRVHTGERPFRCNVCDKTFITLSKLRQHRRSKGHGLQSE